MTCSKKRWPIQNAYRFSLAGPFIYNIVRYFYNLVDIFYQLLVVDEQTRIREYCNLNKLKYKVRQDIFERLQNTNNKKHIISSRSNSNENYYNTTNNNNDENVTHTPWTTQLAKNKQHIIRIQIRLRRPSIKYLQSVLFA